MTRIWVDYRDVAGAPELNFIRDTIEGAARGRGFLITKDPDEAEFQYRVWLRFFGEDPSRDGGSSLLNNAGAIGAGAAAGLVTEGLTDSTVAAVGVGLGAAAISKTAMDNYSQVVEWGMILDIEIYERVEGGVQETRGSEKGSSSAVTAAVNTGSQGLHGQDRSGNQRNQSYSRTTELYLHHARLWANAFQIGMERGEAIGELQKSIPSAIGNMLP